MRWKDVGRFLEGSIPAGDCPTGGAGLVVTPSLNADLSFFNTTIQHCTEMEATVRVFSFVKDAIQQSKNPLLKLRLQPSLVDYADFAIVTEIGEPQSLIEVKNRSINTSLAVETRSTAQVLREVHILLTVYPQLRTLPFALTNADIWSFGLAERTEGNKFRVTKHFLLFLSRDVPLLCHCLMYFVQGMWPPEK